MDKIVSTERQATRRWARINALGSDSLGHIVAAADAFIVAGLCGDPQRRELDELLVRLRLAGLADS